MLGELVWGLEREDGVALKVHGMVSVKNMAQTMHANVVCCEATLRGRRAGGRGRGGRE